MPDPSLSWDEVLAPHFSPAARTRLDAARVGLMGAGGLGSNCALLLVRSGIRQLCIADHDRVAASNLNRQAYWPRHLGMLKVEALAEVLLALRPELDLALHPLRLTAHNALDLFAGCDIVVEAVDDPACKSLLVNAMLEAGHTVVAASGMAGLGGEMGRKHLGARLTVVGDLNRAVNAGEAPLAPRVQMAAALQADEVLCRLLGPIHFQQ